MPISAWLITWRRKLRTNGAWKARDKKDGERRRAQWEDLVPQAREWLDEQNPDTQVSIHQQLVLDGNWQFSGTPEESGKNPGNEVPLAAVVPGTVDRVKM